MAAIAKGCMITNKGRAIIIEKKSLKLKFDKEIKQKMVSYVESSWKSGQTKTTRCLWSMK